MPEEAAPSSDAGAEARLAAGAWESRTLRPRRAGVAIAAAVTIAEMAWVVSDAPATDERG